jgi:hypothetical protein
MRKLLALIALTVLSGCNGAEYKLEDRWLPLKSIRERPAVLQNAAPETTITTVGEYAYVRDLDDWFARTPVGSAKFQAVMRHEQEHSKRQLDTGTWLWVTRYGVDKDFALAEEQRGYYYEITERRRLGDQVIPEAYALVLSKYKILVGRLISYEDALTWVRAVLRGQWTPPD